MLINNKRGELYCDIPKYDKIIKFNFNLYKYILQTIRKKK